MLSSLSLLWFGTPHSHGYIFPYLLCLLLLFFSQLCVRPPQITILPFCIWCLLIVFEITGQLFCITDISKFFSWFSSIQFHSVTQSSPTFCDSMNCSTPGFPVHHQTSRVCSNSRPSSQWCHPTISSSVVPFSSHLQSFPASGSFPMSQFFTSSGQSIGASPSASVLPMNIQDWFPLGWTGLVSLLSKGLSRVFTNTTIQKHQFFSAQLIFLLGIFQISYIYPPTAQNTKGFFFSLPQFQALFQRVSSSNQEDKVLEFQLQHQSFH